MTRLKISKKQYDSIILKEHMNRLQDNTDTIFSFMINESTLLNEGWKEVVLGVSMLVGVNLTGQNKKIAQDAVNNDKTMSQIKSILEDSEKIKELVDAMEQKGLKDPNIVLSKNAEKIVDSFNDLSKNIKLDVKVINNLLSLDSKTNEDTENLEHKPFIPITIKDVLNIDICTDNLFIDGGFTLTKSGNDIIEIIIKEIEKQSGKIIELDIEVSTDSYPIDKFKTETDPTGNIKLSDMRMKSIVGLINSLNSGVSMTHREIPNNGVNIVSSKEFTLMDDSDKLTSLKEKTKEFRYIKLKIVSIFENKHTSDKPEPIDIIKDYRLQIIKIIMEAGKNRNIEIKPQFNMKKFKCNRNESGDSISDECITWQ